MSVGFSPSPAQLDRYLDKIGVHQRPQPNAAGLALVHRHHAQAISWENLDMQLGRITTTDPEAAYLKIVEGRRGGWCYEMNGLLGAMLMALGFPVRRLSAGVMREQAGDFAVGNHLALLVELDQPWLADIGLGSGLIEPVPLREGSYLQQGRTFRLERLDETWWRFHTPPGSMPSSFDFNPDLADEALMSERCHWLQTDPASPFHRCPVVQRYSDGKLLSLIRADLQHSSPENSQVRRLDSAKHFGEVLAEQFDLQIDDVAALWEICEQMAA